MNTIFRAFIADDEPPARSKIRKFLEGRTEVKVCGEAGDGLNTIQGVLELHPDVLFLDIQMPKGDGFDVLREIYPCHKPAVIFTTAYDQYAIRAFEVEALDYLLKPFTADRFRAAVDRALRARGQSGAEASAVDGKLERLLAHLASTQVSNQRVLVRNNDRLFFVKASEIEWVEAEEKYVLLHTRNERHIVRQGISALERQLTPVGFVRIHRSHLLNLEALGEIVTLGRGDCLVVLKSGQRLPVGRNYKEVLLATLARPSPGL